MTEGVSAALTHSPQLGDRIAFTVFAWLWLMAGADLLRENNTTE